MAHWKKHFDYRFLSGDELTGEMTVTIKSSATEEVFNPSSNSKENALAIYFEEGKKGLIINKTNAKTISKVVGSPDTNDWVGKKIIIFPKKGKFFGEDMQVVRVKMQKVTV